MRKVFDMKKCTTGLILYCVVVASLSAAAIQVIKPYRPKTHACFFDKCSQVFKDAAEQQSFVISLRHETAYTDYRENAKVFCDQWQRTPSSGSVIYNRKEQRLAYGKIVDFLIVLSIVSFEDDKYIKNDLFGWEIANTLTTLIVLRNPTELRLDELVVLSEVCIVFGYPTEQAVKYKKIKNGRDMMQAAWGDNFDIVVAQIRSCLEAKILQTEAEQGAALVLRRSNAVCSYFDLPLKRSNAVLPHGVK